MNTFPLIVFNKSSSSSSDLSSDIPFEKEIINKAKQTISRLSKVNFKRVLAIPHFDKVSLQKVFADYGCPVNSKMRIYINGSTHRTT